MGSDSSLRLGKIVFLSLCVMTILPSYIDCYPRSKSSELVFKKIGETDDYNRFAVEQDTSASDDCQSGQVSSHYCKSKPDICKSGSFQINFSPKFSNPPKVVIGLSLLDIDKNENTRVRVETKDITSAGFKISFEPWDAGIAYQMGVHWMACP